MLEDGMLVPSESETLMTIAVQVLPPLSNRSLWASYQMNMQDKGFRNRSICCARLLCLRYFGKHTT